MRRRIASLKGSTLIANCLDCAVPGQDAGDPLLGQVPQRGRVRGGGELGPADLRGLGHGLLCVRGGGEGAGGAERVGGDQEGDLHAARDQGHGPAPEAPQQEEPPR